MAEAELTIPEWASVLEPPLSERQVRLLVELVGIPQAGARRLGRPGRPFPTYGATAIMRAHAALVTLMAGVAA